MIHHLRGKLFQKREHAIIVEVEGVGYEVSITTTTFRQLPPEESEVIILTSESVAMYGGGTTLYGFLTREEREIFEIFRQKVPNTGAKKALEHADKAAKSLPDFRRAILEGDTQMLCGIFGFTKKTAERLITALKDKIVELPLTGGERWVAISSHSHALTQALEALVSLGYKESEAREALNTAHLRSQDELTAEEFVREALKRL